MRRQFPSPERTRRPRSQRRTWGPVCSRDFRVAGWAAGTYRGIVIRVLLALALVLAAPHGRDRKPPVFAGVQSATTCVPGPAGGGTASYTLTWKAARDDRTPARQIVYDVYATTVSGGENYHGPTGTSKPGATTFATRALSSAKTWWFVVRARDASGNRDRNRHELGGVNLCD